MLSRASGNFVSMYIYMLDIVCFLIHTGHGKRTFGELLLVSLLYATFHTNSSVISLRFLGKLLLFYPETS